MDMIEFQIEMEKLFSNNQLMPRIRREFTNSEFNFRKHMHTHGIDTDFGFDLLVQMVLHKRAPVPVLVGVLRRHFAQQPNPSQTAADMLLKAVEADLVDFNSQLGMFIVRFDISRDVQDDLDRYQFPLPMIVPPKQLEDNRDNGYYTARDSIILKQNHHDDDVCLDHLNKMNNIKFRINSETAVMVHNQWRNLDHAKPGEDRKDYQKRVKAFEKYDRTAKDVMSHLEIAGNEFWLTHKVDKRGRVYCQGYHVNYQGNGWNKAVVEFAEGEVVNG